MTSPQGLAVSAAHDAAQARLLDLGLAELASIFSAVDVLNDADYPRLAALSVAKTRAQAVELARSFYSAHRAAETGAQGLRAPFLVPTPDAPAMDLLETSMSVTGPIAAKTALANGAAVAEALTTALTMTLGSATRHVEGGPRDVTRLGVMADPLARGWSRRSGGVPCSFCAMHISRGPVYKSEGTSSFKAHDHCHCKAVSFFGTDSGWTAQSAEFASLWNLSKALPNKTFDDLYRARFPKTKSPKKLTEEAYRSHAARKAAETRRAKTRTEAPQEPATPRSPFSTAYGTPTPAKAATSPPVPSDSLVDSLPRFHDGVDLDRDELARLTNPGYQSGRGDFENNCTHVSSTYELRRRGYNVTASPLPGYLQGAGRQPHEVLERWRTAEGGKVAFTRSKPKHLVDDLDRDLPEGGRAVVFGYWRAGGGHIWNAEKIDGKVRFIEAQSPLGSFSPEFYTGRLGASTPAAYLRVDDKVPHESILEFVHEKGDLDAWTARQQSA